MQNKKHIVLKKGQIETKGNPFLEEVISGLNLCQKEISCKFCYDEKGSELYTRISADPDYYPNRIDKEILIENAKQILEFIGNDEFNLIDLGAGDGNKTEILLKMAIEQNYKLNYIPLDISFHSNQSLLQKFSVKFPELQMVAITAEYEEGVEWISQNLDKKNVYFLLGGTIGNQKTQEAVSFLEIFQKHMKKNDLFFLTADFWKKVNIISRAYDTRPSKELMNNLIHRINSQLYGNFDLSRFDLYIYIDPLCRTVIGRYISLCQQQVSIQDKKFMFKQSQTLKVFQSKKFLSSQINQIFIKIGMTNVKIFKDSKGYMGFFVYKKLDAAYK